MQQKKKKCNKKDFNTGTTTSKINITNNFNKKNAFSRTLVKLLTRILIKSAIIYITVQNL